MTKPARRTSPARTQRFSYTFHRILTGSDLSRRRLPVMTVTSKSPGPTVWLTACAHGDEVGGIVVIQDVFKRLRKHPLLRGAVHAFPLMNPLGFEVGQRHISLSAEDLNRSFPGDAEGTLAQRIAAHIFQHIVATDPAAVIDLHNDWIRSIPYAVLDATPNRRNAAYRTTRSLALNSGLVAVVEPSETPGSLSHTLLQHGIAALTLELGEAMAVVERHVSVGVDAVWRVLAELGLVDAADITEEATLPETLRDKVLRYSSKPFSSTTGIIRFVAQPGNIVSAGQPVARIVNAFGKLQETILAPADAVILGRSDSSVAFPGAPIMAYGEI